MVDCGAQTVPIDPIAEITERRAAVEAAIKELIRVKDITSSTNLQPIREALTNLTNLAIQQGNRISYLEELLLNKLSNQTATSKTDTTVLNKLTTLDRKVSALSVKTYASVVGKELTSKPRNPQTIEVKSTDQVTTTTEIITALQRTGPPAIKIDRLVPLKDKVLIKVSEQEDLRSLLKQIQNTGCLSTRTLRKSQPKIILYGIPKSIPDSDILSALLQTYGEFKVFRRNTSLRNEDRQDLVLEGNFPSVTAASKRGALNLGFYKFSIRRFVELQRCLRCQGLGHPSSACKEEATCAYCSGPHYTSKCTANMPKCVNCIASNNINDNTEIQTDHPASASQCPTYRARLHHLISQCRAETRTLKDLEPVNSEEISIETPENPEEIRIDTPERQQTTKSPVTRMSAQVESRHNDRSITVTATVPQEVRESNKQPNVILEPIPEHLRYEMTAEIPEASAQEYRTPTEILCTPTPDKTPETIAPSEM